MASASNAMDTLGKDIDKKDMESYMTSPRRRSVVIDEDRHEIPIQMNPQLDSSKLRSVAGRPPTPIPSDEEEDDEDEQNTTLVAEGSSPKAEKSENREKIEFKRPAKSPLRKATTLPEGSTH